MAKATVDRPGRDAYWRGSQAHAGVAQLVRVPACHAGGRGFEPRHSRHSLSFWTEWRPRLGIMSSLEIEAGSSWTGASAAPAPQFHPAQQRLQRQDPDDARDEVEEIGRAHV